MSSVRKASMSLKEINDSLYRLGVQSIDKRYIRVLLDDYNISGHLVIGTYQSSKVRVLGFVPHYNIVVEDTAITAYTYINLLKRKSTLSRAVSNFKFVIV